MTEQKGPTRVLLVEDDTASRLIYNAYLVSAGYEVALAGDGDAAIQAARLKESLSKPTDFYFIASYFVTMSFFYVSS